jgi:DNA-binding MarR family transcriptional regulator
VTSPVELPEPNPVIHLDDVVHQRVRLGLLAVLHEARTADFSYLKSVLHVTDGNLGQHLDILERHKLITVRKGYQGRRPRTWISITRAGDAALKAEVEALRKLLGL